MFESLRVATILEMTDEASPKIDALFERVDRLNVLFDDLNEKLRAFGYGNRINATTRRFAALNDQLARTTELAGAAAGAMDAASASGFVAGGRGAARSDREVSPLERAAAGAGRPRREVSGLERAAAGGGGHGHGDVRIHGYMETPGGSVHYGMGPTLVSGAILGFGAYQNAQLQRRINLALGVAGHMPATMVPTKWSRELRREILTASEHTGFGPIAGADAMLQTFKMMAGFSIKDRLAVLPTVFRTAYEEGQLNHVPLPEAARSLLELIHMRGRYGPAYVKKLAGEFLALSTTTPLTMPQQVRALGYTVAAQRELNIDPTEIAAMGSTMQRAGIISTRSGTWMATFLQRLFPMTSLSGQLTGAGGSIFGSHAARSTTLRGLEALGLYSRAGKPLFMHHGAVAMRWILQKLHHDFQTMSIPARTNAMEMAFGRRGSRGAVMFSIPQFMRQFPALMAFAKRYRGVDMLANYYSDSAYQQYKVLGASLDVALLELTKSINVTLSPAIIGLTKWIQRADAAMRTHATATGDVATGLLGAVGVPIVAKGVQVGAGALGLDAGLGALVGAPGVALGASGVGLYELGRHHDIWGERVAEAVEQGIENAIAKFRGLDVRIRDDRSGRLTARASHPTSTSTHTGAAFADPAAR